MLMCYGILHVKMNVNESERAVGWVNCELNER